MKLYMPLPCAKNRSPNLTEPLSSAPPPQVPPSLSKWYPTHPYKTRETKVRLICGSMIGVD
ncbi:hypothetical protein Scep_019019 [Stephania cephalantha]|uniref:Uncharacterized protein n=1 Tax=Stephania cephalantha TaxID=152367 RepID=A0AAP0IA58_9MAGN